MMRRGPIDRYPIEWVLEQVALFEVSGTIELNTDHPATLFVRDGALCLVLAGIVEEAPDGPRGEATARRSSVEVLAEALRAREGWYYHHALGGHRLDVPWRWEVSTLVAEAKAGVAGPAGGGRWDGARVELRAGVPVPIAALGADAWSVVVAMAAPAQADAVAARLGWPPERIGEALDELAAARLVVGPSGPAGLRDPFASTDPVGGAAAGTAPLGFSAAPSGLVHEAPTTRPAELRPAAPLAWDGSPPADRAVAASFAGLPAPPPPARRPDVRPAAADDRRGALRRLISSLRAG